MIRLLKETNTAFVFRLCSLRPSAGIACSGNETLSFCETAKVDVCLMLRIK